MAYENDYIMRMIKEAIRALAAFALGRDLPPYELPEEKENYTERDRLYEQLITLAEEGKINEAENLLFDHIDDGIDDIFQLGINFYLYINEFSNDKLDESDYPREELIEGIKDFSRACGVEMSDGFFQLIS